MGLNRYQLTFESYGNHYQIYGRDIQDVMGGVTEGLERFIECSKIKNVNFFKIKKRKDLITFKNIEIK